MQLAWQYPGLAPWLEGLRQRFQLIQMDCHGAGMSSRGLPEDFAYQHYQPDLEAVVAKLNLPPLVPLGIAGGAPAALEFAVDHPERVLALVLSGVAAPSRSAFFRDLPEEDWELFLYGLMPRDRSPEDSRKTVGLLAQTTTAQDFVRCMRAWLDYPIDPLLRRLRTPTLIFRPKDHVLVEAATAMQAAQLAGAKMLLIEGATVFGDAEHGIRAIEAFLTEIAPAGPFTVPRRDSLSGREIEVLRLIAGGRSNAQIGEILVISPYTVARHVSNIFDKLGLGNRAEATAYALRKGLV